MRQDCDNAIASINDVLQDAGIIDDDVNITDGSNSGPLFGSRTVYGG